MSRDSNGGEPARQSARNADETTASAPRGRSVAEWTTLIISALLILFLVGLVTSVSVTDGNQPPLIEATAETGEILHEGALYYLPVTVTNRGDETAQEVRILAEVTTGDGALETAEFTIEVLAGGEVMQGTVVFTVDPAANQLTVAVNSFQ